MTANSLAESLSGRPSAGGWIAHCPAHDDRNPSLSISELDGKILVHCLAGCTQTEVIGELIALGLWEGGHQSPRIQAQPCNLENYADSKKLPQEFLGTLGLVDFTYNSKPAVKMPYYDVNGEEIAANFRLSIGKNDCNLRFNWKKGTKKHLYGLWRLHKHEHIVLVEGESDCHTLWHHNIPALGLPGAGCWKDDRDSKHFDGINEIYVIIEPDQGGESVKQWLAHSSIKERVKLVSLPRKDPSELYLNNPDSFVELFNKALETAQPYSDYERLEMESEHNQAWEQCKYLANEINILGRFLDDFTKLGVVGEDRTGKLLYLALTSRLLPHPVSVVVKGPSSGGKSYCVEKVLEFFPADAFYKLTAMSDRSLVYLDEPLQHRFLVICEASGIESEMATYLIRSLLSEGRLSYQTVEKTPDGLRTRHIEIEGPTGLLTTTTKVKLHPENETRLISIPVIDTQNQTRAVLAALAQEYQEDVDLNDWQALQTWLVGANRTVTIPYADDMASMIPPIAVRLRRDFTAILNLIRSHALLHQCTRKRDSRGRIVAEIQDYAVVKELVEDLVAEGVEASVSETLRETVTAVGSLVAEYTQVTISQVASKLKLDKSAASRRVKAALERGYLKNNASKPRQYHLALRDPLPEDIQILPDPAKLQVCLADREEFTPPPARERVSL